MKAIILAAGIGKRLGEQAKNKPKSLLVFGKKSLLERHIDILMAHDIDELTIVTGYGANMIEAHLADSPANINFVFNPRFKEGSIISLACAKAILSNETEFILMDADVLYADEMINRLTNTNIKNCLLLDRDFIPGNEPVKICVDKNSNIIEFRKQIATDLRHVIQGESVGVFKFTNFIGTALLERIDAYLAEGKNEIPYEEAIRDLLLIYPEQFGYEDVTGIPWVEIDFPEDIDRAQKDILSKLTALQKSLK